MFSFISKAQFSLPYNNNGFCFGKPDTLGLPKVKTSRAAVGDFNTDGKKDIAFFNHLTNQINILYNTGTTFTVASAFTILNFTDLSAGDLDNDGDADLVAITNNSLTILNNTTPSNSNTFVKVVVPNTVSFPNLTLRLVETDDLDNDGSEEIITRGFDAAGLNMRIIKCISNFSTVQAGTGFYGILGGGLSNDVSQWSYAAGDVTGDGKKEFAVSVGSVNNGIVTVHQTSVNSSFVGLYSTVNITTQSIFGLLLEDVTNDGKSDLFCFQAGTPQNILVSSAPTFTTANNITVGTNNVRSFCFYKDFNNDGKKDVLGLDNVTGFIKINPGLSPTQYSVAPNPINIITSTISNVPKHALVEDFNSDGLPDILLIGNNPTIDFGPAIMYNRSYNFSVIGTPSTSICQGNSYTVATTFSYNPRSITWLPSSINANTLVVSTNNLINSQVSYTLPIAESANTCSLNSLNSFTPAFLPSPNFNAVASNTSICQGTSITINATASTNLTYTISPGNQVGSTSSATVPSIFPTTSTIYTISSTEITSGCIRTRTVQINVTPSPTISVSYSPQTICLFNSVTITLAGATIYTLQLFNPSQTFTNSGAITFTPQSLNASIKVIGESNSCTDTTAVIPLNVNPNPSITVVPTNTTTCKDGLTKFVLNGGNTYSLNSTQLASNNYDDYFSTATNLIFEGSNQFGCKTFATSTVNIFPEFTNEIVASSNKVCEGDSVNLSIQNIASIAWNTSQITPTIFVKPIQNTTYFAVVEDANNCSYTRSISIEMDTNCEIKTHNVVTPNGDGLNDVFIIDNISKYPNQVSIFNRWGLLLKEFKNYDNKERAWPADRNVVEGTYYYVIEVEINNSKKITKGWVEIL